MLETQEGNRKLRRGSNRSSQSSTPAEIKSGRASAKDGLSNGGGDPSATLSGPLQVKEYSDTESSCNEESRRRTAEAFMAGIQSAISTGMCNVNV